MNLGDAEGGRQKRGETDGDMDGSTIDDKATVRLRADLPFADHLGFEVLEVSQERVRMRARWDTRYCTSAGVLHGGFLMALADTAGAMAAVQHLPEGAATTTIESKTNFLRAVREGDVIATAEPLHAGRTSIVVTTDIRDAGGKLVSRTTQTQLVIR
ncbi:MAG: PaaI family thioesterase [Dehalococcoidia bacterium]